MAHETTNVFDKEFYTILLTISTPIVCTFSKPCQSNRLALETAVDKIEDVSGTIFSTYFGIHSNLELLFYSYKTNPLKLDFNYCATLRS